MPRAHQIYANQIYCNPTYNWDINSFSVFQTIKICRTSLPKEQIKQKSEPKETRRPITPEIFRLTIEGTNLEKSNLNPKISKKYSTWALKLKKRYFFLDFCEWISRLMRNKQLPGKNWYMNGNRRKNWELALWNESAKKLEDYLVSAQKDYCGEKLPIIIIFCK